MPVPTSRRRPDRPRPLGHPRLDALEDRSVPATFRVLTPAAAGPGSLAQAIADANARAGADTIQFQIPGAGVQTITGALPAVTDPVTIDGTTQPGYAGRPVIELSGGGLDVGASNCRITGLIINRSAGYGIALSGPGRNVIQGNYIGTDATGQAGAGNLRGGVYVAPGCNDNVIGTNGDGVNDAAEGNVISANGFFNRRFLTGGVFIDGGHRNVVAGNLIGTNAAGTGLLYNLAFGVGVVNGGQQNRIGTNGNGVSDGLERNLITGYMAGVYLGDFGTSNNVVAGNYIGTDVTGTVALDTGGTGVTLAVGADHNRIGTDANGRADALERNVISGHRAAAGVDVQSDLNTIAGNYIGTTADGSAPLGNYVGVQVTGGATIGGARAAARNVISGNAAEGVSLQGGTATVQGNIIGLTAVGDAALANAYGVLAYYTTGLTIGGATAGARNVISGNANDGINLSYLSGPATIQGNYIGTDVSGTLAIGNGTPGAVPAGRGIDLWAANDVTIGGATAGARNVISGNVLDGVAVESGSTGTVITGNYIGTDATGKAARGNGGAGVLLTGLVAHTTIGGTTAGLRNVVAANQVGIHVADGSANTVMQGNYIGTDNTGKVGLGNAGPGVRIDGGSSGNVVGAAAGAVPAAGVGNVIAFNGGAGVAVADPTSLSNTVRANSIFANSGPGIDVGTGVALAPPTLTRVVAGTATRAVGTFAGAANTSYTLDLYATPAGLDQGKRYLGSVLVTTDAAGLAAFDVTLAAATRLGEVVTATTTDGPGNTSVFSVGLTAGR